MQRVFFLLGAGFAFLAVAAGAFGAHLLATSLTSSQLDIFQTAARYQMYHALALLIVGGMPETKRTQVAGWCFVAGIMLFSGSLYGLSMTGIKILGVITPLGGLAWLIGWVCLGLAGWQQKS
jgi:uncharacterized membrane protein YgdD (TMEM256/DUF423 family)